MSIVYTDNQHYSDIADSIRGKLNTQDTYLPEDMADAIDSIPTGQQVSKGLVFSDYDSDGYPHKAEFVGSWTSIPQNYCRDMGGSGFNFFYKITHLDIPNGVTSLGAYAIYNTRYLTSISLPQTLTSIGNNCFNYAGLLAIEIPSGVTEIPPSCFNVATYITQIVMKGDITKIYSNAFRATWACELFDFSNCTAVPTVETGSFDQHKSGCVIKVPQSLLATWQTSGNWANLTDVVWQGV